jgi:hypothetical protein
MSRDALSHDPRNGLEQESDSSHTRITSRSAEPAGHVEGLSTKEHPGIDAERHPSRQRKPEAVDTPRAHYLGNRAYFLRESELQTLGEVGTFRAIAANDLAAISYGGDTKRMEREIRHLKQQALISEKAVRGNRHRTIGLIALTKKGARLTRNSGVVPERQAIYHGFVKPREAKHDANLYRLYQAQAERIEAAGGRVSRIVLDYELKANLNRDLASLPPEQQSDETREQIAERNGLSIVNGKIPVPDMRLEYDTAEMERRHVDLELATRNYRPRALAEKARAGFSLYELREDASRLRHVLDEREINADILSL